MRLALKAVRTRLVISTSRCNRSASSSNCSAHPEGGDVYCLGVRSEVAALLASRKGRPARPAAQRDNERSQATIRRPQPGALVATRATSAHLRCQACMCARDGVRLMRPVEHNAGLPMWLPAPRVPAPCGYQRPASQRRVATSASASPRRRKARPREERRSPLSPAREWLEGHGPRARARRAGRGGGVGEQRGNHTALSVGLCEALEDGLEHRERVRRHMHALHAHHARQRCGRVAPAGCR